MADFWKRIIEARPELIGTTVYFSPTKKSNLPCILRDDGTVSPSTAPDRRFSCINVLADEWKKGLLTGVNGSKLPKNVRMRLAFNKDFYFKPERREIVRLQRRIPVPERMADTSTINSQSMGGFIFDVLRFAATRSRIFSIDQEILKAILDILDRRKDDFELSVSIQIFSEALYRLIATNGQGCAMFLLRNQNIQDRWQKFWSYMNTDISCLDYDGVDSLPNYVLSIIFRAASIMDLRNVSEQRQNLNTFSESRNIELYQFPEQMDDGENSNSDFGIHSNLIDNASSAISSRRTMEQSNRDENESDHEFDSPVSTIIPSPFRQRYHDQSVYFIMNGRKKLNKWAKDTKIAEFLNTTLDNLASSIVEESGNWIIVPSPELMEILFLIDEFAARYENDTARVAGMTLKNALRNDSMIIRTVRNLVKNVSVEFRRDQAVILIDFILDMTRNSLWKLITDVSGVNKKDQRTVSFRTELQIGSSK